MKVHFFTVAGKGVEAVALGR